MFKQLTTITKSIGNYCSKIIRGGEGGGQGEDKPAGIGCLSPVIRGISSDVLYTNRKCLDS